MQEVLKWMCKERDGDSKGFLEIINNTYLTVNSCVPVSVSEEVGGGSVQ